MTEPEARDIRWMRRAIALARRGIGRTHPNPRVGALVVDGDELVGEGWHRGPGQDHAEVLALRQAGERARGATLYVTLEPCHAHGRTPPCTEAIARAGLRRVVYASCDPNPRMRGGGAYLRRIGVDVQGGVLRSQADRINLPFFRWIHHSMPYVIAKAAVSLDGKLATGKRDSRWITGEAARRHAHGERARADAIVVGGGTFLHDDPALNVRHARLCGAPPLRVVMMRHAPEFRARCRLLRVRERAGGVRFYLLGSDAPPDDERVRHWRRAGVDVVRCADVEEALRHLAVEGRLQVLLEGGGRLHAMFFSRRLSQELLLYQAPCLIGGADAVSLWHGRGVDSVARAISLADVESRALGRDRMIRGLLRYPGDEARTSRNDGG